MKEGGVQIYDCGEKSTAYCYLIRNSSIQLKTFRPRFSKKYCMINAERSEAAIHQRNS
jgi:hypothetical protein